LSCTLFRPSDGKTVPYTGNTVSCAHSLGTVPSEVAAPDVLNCISATASVHLIVHNSIHSGGVCRRLLRNVVHINYPYSVTAEIRVTTVRRSNIFFFIFTPKNIFVPTGSLLAKILGNSGYYTKGSLFYLTITVGHFRRSFTTHVDGPLSHISTPNAHKRPAVIVYNIDSIL